MTLFESLCKECNAKNEKMVKVLSEIVNDIMFEDMYTDKYIFDEAKYKFLKLFPYCK